MSKRKADVTWRPNIEQTAITTTGSSQQCAAFGAQTYCVRLAVAATTAARGVYYSLTPTATANSPHLSAGNIEYVAVYPGQKIAFLQETGALKVTVTEMTR